MTKRRVVICGIVFDYEEKAPYVTSGRSLRGALELDETGTKVKCHECGTFWPWVSRHCGKTHGLSVGDYKRKHGFRSRSSLLAPSVRAAMRQDIIRAHEASGFEEGRSRGLLKCREINLARRAAALAEGKCSLMSMEARNLKNRCDEQLIGRIRKISADLGGVTPRQSQIDGGLYAAAMVNLGAKSIGELMEKCGLRPNPAPHYTHALLVELLRDAYVALGRPITRKDCRPPLLPSSPTFTEYFGSWEAALMAAGLALVTRSPAGLSMKRRWHIGSAPAGPRKIWTPPEQILTKSRIAGAPV